MSLDRINLALRRRSKETQVPLEHGEYDTLLKQYRVSRKMKFKDLLASMKKSGDYYPFPVRAQPDVELFFEHPEWTVSKKMAKAAAKAVKDWGPNLFADIKYDGCYDVVTEVLTIDGWKFFKDITMDDELATLKDSKYLEYNKPNDIIVENFDGDLIHIENTSIDLMVTPNHQLYTIVLDKGGHKHGDYRFVRADEFEQGIFKKNAEWIGESPENVIIGRYEIPINLWVEFMGYWLSEGWIYYSEDKYRYEVGISQSKEKSREIMRICLERLIGVIGKKLNDYDDRFVFSDKDICLYLRQFGKALDKYIPMSIKRLNKFLLLTFLGAFSLGDGHKRDNYWALYSTSKRLMDDMQEIVLKAGYAGRVYMKSDEYIAPANSKLSGLKCSKLYQLSIYRNSKKSRLETRIIPCVNKNQIVESVGYTGEVYCVNIENHVIYVRRNGKACWCGNCRTLLYVNPKTKEVRLYSRRLKELHKMEGKYATAILNNVSKLIVDETVFDTEAYATDSEGRLLPFGTVLGWVRNPDDVKYQNLLPSIETFDMVMLNGKDIREMPLKYRKRLLETVIKKRDGLVLDVADTRLMKNHPRPIEWRFKAVIKGKGEGLVLKHPAEEYYYGKKSIKNKGWAKLKAGDTLDLELKAIEVSPRGKPFKDYRHWLMVTADNELHEIKANKAIVAAKFDNEFYRNFSLDMINQWKLGRLVAAGRMIDVDKDLVKFYGTKKVPTRLTYPKNKRMIVEIFTERITETLHPSGTKVVGIREDKKIADKMKDIKDLRAFFLNISEE